MDNKKISKKDYYLNSSILFFRTNFEKRLKFLKKKIYLFNEISNFINNCIDSTKNIFVFCAGNSILAKNIKSKKIYVKEIDEKYQINYNDNIEYINDDTETIISNCDTILISDIEHQLNPTASLLNLSNLIKDDTKVIILSRNLVWMVLIKFLKFFFNFSPKKNNFLPSSYLENLYSSCNLEIVRNEKIIAFPIFIPYLTNFFNRIFRLPLLNIFCLSSITILKKKNQKHYNENNSQVSFIIPCKNEENNINLFEKEILNSDPSNEYLFGDDSSTDSTNIEIDKLSKKLIHNKIKKYSGPGICKSENVYKGIELSDGDIIVIYDADLTVSFKDIELSLEILKKTNADFINCTRMIYPQKDGAMKFLNFIGNSFFAGLFSVLFKKKITDTLCGTKIFYKKDWNKIKKDVSNWGMKDLWGDFDLLIGAYKNNLKIIEVPVTYYERKNNDTKMTSLITNTLRMLFIVIASYYKLRLKK
mgnify:CR=1 FL=1|tara:strand:- start:2492 stop:3916 length:1425 start_codon:yes stop_codon:yes gene_type:complete